MARLACCVMCGTCGMCAMCMCDADMCMCDADMRDDDDDARGQVTDDQKYGMIEAIAHLLNRDYEEIIQDFVSLEVRLGPSPGPPLLLPRGARCTSRCSWRCTLGLAQYPGAGSEAGRLRAPGFLTPTRLITRHITRRRFTPGASVEGQWRVGHVVREGCLYARAACCHADAHGRALPAAAWATNQPWAWNVQFIPPETDIEELKKELLPALKNVFDQALSGGGARGINFNELAGVLAQITFKFPFRIPPYFALVIRAIGVLEGIALVRRSLGFRVRRSCHPRFLPSLPELACRPYTHAPGVGR